MDFSPKLKDNFIFDLVADSSEKLGYETYIVGGFVRDLILKRDSKDIDFVCVGSGLDLARKVSESIKEKKSIAMLQKSRFLIMTNILTKLSRITVRAHSTT